MKVNRITWSKIKSKWEMLKASAVNVIIEETIDKAMEHHETYMQRDIFGNVHLSHQAYRPSKTRAEEIIERIRSLRDEEKKAVAVEDYKKAAEIKSKIDILINMYNKL